jgi:cation:H+ antiporter
VDIYFAWSGGKNPEYLPYASANMTGANRILIGLGWAAVVFVQWLKSGKKTVELKPRLRLEIGVLLAATLYSFFIPIKGTLSWVDSVVLISLFLFYFSRVLRGKIQEPELEGPVKMVEHWKPWPRRLLASFFFIVPVLVIFSATEPFSNGLLAVGRQWGIDNFILVQWIAPLASEAPGFIVALVFAARALAGNSFNTLLSSKINQWTLLVGMLPLAYSLSSGVLKPIVLDPRQTEEIFLTAAQSLFAVAVLSDLKFSLKEAFWVAFLFLTQAVYPFFEKQIGVPSQTLRFFYGGFYIVLTVGWLAFSSRNREGLLRLGTGFFTKETAFLPRRHDPSSYSRERKRDTKKNPKKP